MRQALPLTNSHVTSNSSSCVIRTAAIFHSSAAAANQNTATQFFDFPLILTQILENRFDQSLDAAVLLSIIITIPCVALFLAAKYQKYRFSFNVYGKEIIRVQEDPLGQHLSI